MSVAVAEPGVVSFDPLRDRSYRDAALGRDVVDWLAWLELGGTAERTLDQYERDLARVCVMYPSKALADLTDGDLGHVVASWPKASRRVRKAAIDSFFKWAVRTRRVDTNPMAFLPVVKRRKQPYVETFTPAECEALMGLPLADGALCTLLLEAGLRKSEARHLRVKHALPESGLVVVIGGKGDKDRVIPMWGRLRQSLADLVLVERLSREDHLWYDRPGGGSVIRRKSPIADGSFDRWWRRCVEGAGVRYLKPHTTRHTMATNARRRGLSIDEIQKLLGHSSIATTESLYVHTGIEDVARHMAAIEKEMAHG